jgi:hypothetical protein
MAARLHPTETWPTERILAAFAAVARPLIRQHFPANSCIASTRIAIKVARTFGLRARPLAARVWVANEALMALLAKTPDPTHAQVLDWKRMGAAGLSIGGEKPARFENGLWNRHLLAVVERQWLVDASIDQGNERGGLAVPGVLVARYPEPFEPGPWSKSYWLLDGTRIDYTFEPAESSYRTAPDWHLRPVAAETARAIAAAMWRELLNAAA